MVYRVKNTITQDKLEKISEILKQRYPEYEEIRANAGNEYDADTLLLERGIISENELLQLYAEITGTEPLEEDELFSPEKFTLVKPDYLLNFNLLPYKFDENKWNCWRLLRIYFCGTQRNFKSSLVWSCTFNWHAAV